VHIEQRIRTDGEWRVTGGGSTKNPQLAVVFGPGEVLRERAVWDQLALLYPGARIVGCSTAGEIAGVRVLDDAVVVTAIELEHGRIAVAAAPVGDAPDCVALGGALAAQLPRDGLVHVLVLSEGLKVNGSALVAGIVGGIPPGTGVTGGLSGDGARFERTTVCLDGPAVTQQVVAIGLYGDRLRIGYGSRGGWDPFGPERRITRSQGNVLYELDGEPALDLYKRYLDQHAAGLPATGLLFPLAIRGETGEPVVRTILAIDEAARSLTFAGDVPTGHRARLMKANLERLVEGAAAAAHTALGGNGVADPELALLVSCVGRKLVLKQRIEEEVESVREVLGERTVLMGFYSYGEISPFAPAAPCELHNQTMTITTLAER